MDQRESAWCLLTEFTQSESLRKHALSVEACMRAYARKNGANEELWGLVGLVLAMPFAVCMKLVFQQVPALHRWADLMSCSWQPPSASKAEDTAQSELEPGVVPLSRPDDLPARRGASS